MQVKVDLGEDPAAYAGFALTGGQAREVRVVDANDPDVDWPSLADPHATVVVLDGAERALDICRAWLYENPKRIYGLS